MTDSSNLRNGRHRLRWSIELEKRWWDTLDKTLKVNNQDIRCYWFHLRWKILYLFFGIVIDLIYNQCRCSSSTSFESETSWKSTLSPQQAQSPHPLSLTTNALPHPHPLPIINLQSKLYRICKGLTTKWVFKNGKNSRAKFSLPS